MLRRRMRLSRRSQRTTRLPVWLPPYPLPRVVRAVLFTRSISRFSPPRVISKRSRLPMRCVLNIPLRVTACEVTTCAYGRGLGSCAPPPPPPPPPPCCGPPPPVCAGAGAPAGGPLRAAPAAAAPPRGAGWFDCVCVEHAAANSASAAVPVLRSLAMGIGGGEGGWSGDGQCIQYPGAGNRLCN